MLTGPDYSAFVKAPFTILLEETEVEVYTYRPEGWRVEFVAVKHPLFFERTKVNIYPDGRKPQHFMTFMSLWNRCVAYLLRHYRNTGE
eukprot:5259932-Prymnesium_polylepis.1